MIKRGEEQIRFFKKIKKEHFMIIGALIGLAILMYYIFPIAKPIVLALITALLIERIVNITKNKLRVSRTPAILIVFFVFVTTILGTATFLRSEEHTSELQSRGHLVCRLLLEKKKEMKNNDT